MKTLTSLLLLAASLVSVPALADCDYQPAASYPECVVYVSDLECEGEYLSDAECQAKADRLSLACVAEETCLLAVDGWMEDDLVPLESLETMYGACLDLMAAAARR